MKVKIAELRELGLKALQKFNYSPEESKTILEILLYAQLRGNNQGIVKLIGIGYPKHPEAKPFEIVKETKLSTLINGHLSPAMIVLKKATELTITKAKEHGFGICGTNNTNSSTGAIGYYANEIAKEGLIGFVFAGSPELVATHGSFEPVFGTNPLAVGVPSEEEPIVLDMATAAMARYGLIEAKTTGRSIPDNTAYDKEGNVTTDPAAALEGAIMTFDRSYKSAGLAMIIEILTGSLVGAAFTGIGDSNNWGNLVFAIDPDLLTDIETFKKDISAMIKKVKGAKKLPGVKEIYIPGERGNNLARKRLAAGEIEIEDNLYNELQKAAV